MREYIFGERNGIYIVDLQKTLKMFKEALKFAEQLGREGKTVLFVGTKRQAQEVVSEEAVRAGMFFVNQRWLGGILTNFTTIQKSIGRYKELNAMADEGRFDELSKKEVSRLEKERKRLDKNLRGIQEMNRLPDAVYIIDSKREEIAVLEAKKLKIPVIAVVDTNCDPDVIDYVIPGNDDALRAIKLFTSRLADALIAGRQLKASAVPEEPVAKDVETSSKEGTGDAQQESAQAPPPPA